MANLEQDLEKAKPKHLSETFTMLRGLKLQGIMTDDQFEQIKESIKKFAESPNLAKQIPMVKKNLKKLLSFYDLKVDFSKKKEGKKLQKGVVNPEPEESVPVEKKKKSKKGKNAKKRKEDKMNSAADEDPASLPSFSKLLKDPTREPSEKSKKKKRKQQEADDTQASKKKKN